MANIVTVSGMFGSGHTYFADSPVVIDISGLEWPGTSPFNVVRIEVVYNSAVVGDFKADTGGQSSISLDISSALRAIWYDYSYDDEVSAASSTFNSSYDRGHFRSMRSYALRIYTEYMSSDGVFTQTRCTDGQGNEDIPGGQCLIGGLTEWERSQITDKANADVSFLEHTGVRNGDASTKPTSSPERVGSSSITSWVDVAAMQTVSHFYPSTATPQPDDSGGSSLVGWNGHPPIVLRDSQPYVDFLFINRRGAIETCSGMTKEAMDVGVSLQQYSRSEGPAFKPSRSLMAVGSDGRRWWQMSSGYVTREWAEWWAFEFLGGKRKQWWMLYSPPVFRGRRLQSRYVPVIVKPAKNDISIYDRSKQTMPHVDFTVTLALEG